LGEGAKYWALARTNLDDAIAGDRHDIYMLLATSSDLSMSTIARPTATRVVCQNTLSMALSRSDGKAVKVPHSTVFDPDAIKQQLGLVDIDQSWSTFRERLATLADTEISPDLAREYFSELLRPTGVSPVDRLADRLATRGEHGAESFSDLLEGPARLSATPSKVKTDQAPPERAIRGMADLERVYQTAPGAAPGTAYGALQAVTHWVDHVRGKDTDARVASALFGQGQNLKARALDLAETLAA
jgi:phage/plasmid-like protein (TIGR03299 family)